MQFLRHTLRYALCLVCFSLTNPYSCFTVFIHPLSVTLYLDSADQDEDVFISSRGTDEDEPVFYQEESNRDQDQHGQVKLKLKWDSFCPAKEFVFLFQNTEDGHSFTPSLALEPFTLCIFHPPQAKSFFA